MLATWRLHNESTRSKYSNVHHFVNIITITKKECIEYQWFHYPHATLPTPNKRKKEGILYIYFQKVFNITLIHLLSILILSASSHAVRIGFIDCCLMFLKKKTRRKNVLFQPPTAGNLFVFGIQFWLVELHCKWNSIIQIVFVIIIEMHVNVINIIIACANGPQSDLIVDISSVPADSVSQTRTGRRNSISRI